MSENKLKIGMIGGGFMGQVAHLHNYLKQDNCEVVALAEPRVKLREKLCKKHHIPNAFSTHHDMLKSAIELDAVVIITQRDMTGPIAYDCLKAGKHIITEKPMAATYKQSKKLVELATQNNLIYSVGYMRRHDAGIQKAKQLFDQLIENEELGKLTYIRIHAFDSNPYCNIDDYVMTDEQVPATIEPWASAPEWLPESLQKDYAFFLNVFCHNVNLLRYIVGKNPIAIDYSRLKNKNSRLVVFEYEGFDVLLEAGISKSRPRDEYVEIYFEKGRLRIDMPPNLLRNVPAKVSLYKMEQEHSVIESLCDWSWAFQRQANSFINDIGALLQPLASGQDSLEDMRIIEEIWQKELTRA